MKPTLSRGETSRHTLASGLIFWGFIWLLWGDFSSMPWQEVVELWGARGRSKCFPELFKWGEFRTSFKFDLWEDLMA